MFKELIGLFEALPAAPHGYKTIMFIKGDLCTPNYIVIENIATGEQSLIKEDVLPC